MLHWWGANVVCSQLSAIYILFRYLDRMTKNRPRIAFLPSKPMPRFVSVKKNKKKKKEVTAVGQLLRAAGSYGGNYLGGYFGAPNLGSAAGSQLGALASKWLGFGDYRVSRNTIITDSTASIPAMHKSNQSILVRHKEYVGQITGSIAFNTQYEIPLNPGMHGSFPWLSGVAGRYQEYAFKGVVFHYIPSSGFAVSGSNPALGTVMIQTTYRASDTHPHDKVEMLNEYCASESVPSESFIHPVECDPKENPFNIHYVRAQSPPVGEPLMSYDLGKTFVATSGMPADGNVVGDLWVTYEVELKKPIVTSDVGVGGMYLAQYSGGGSNATIFDGLTSYDGNIQVDASGALLTIPAGSSTQFVIVMDWTQVSDFSAFTCAAPVITNGALKYCNDVPDLLGASTITSGSAKPIIYFVVERTSANKDLFINFAGKITATAASWGSPSLSIFSITANLRP